MTEYHLKQYKQHDVKSIGHKILVTLRMPKQIPILPVVGYNDKAERLMACKTDTVPSTWYSKF